MVAGDAGGLEVVADNGDGNFGVGWDDHRSQDSLFDVASMAPLLAGKFKARAEEDLFELTLGYGSDSRHSYRAIACRSMPTQSGQVHWPFCRR